MAEPAPTLPLTQPPEIIVPVRRREDFYAKIYGRRPGAAAKKLVWLGEQIRLARARGDQADVDSYDEARAALEALLSHLGRCRRCGRALRDPESVRRGIGPECVRKAS